MTNEELLKQIDILNIEDDEIIVDKFPYICEWFSISELMELARNRDMDFKELCEEMECLDRLEEVIQINQ